MKQYEYKILLGSEGLKLSEDEMLLNELGSESWELIAMELIKLKRNGAFAGQSQVYWLKREI